MRNALSLEFEEEPAPTVDYQAVVAEQESAQAPLEYVEDEGLRSSDQFDTESRTLHDDLIQKTDAMVSLEAIANYIRTMADRGELNRPTLTMANVAVESLFDKAGIASTQYAFAMESAQVEHKAQLIAALEGVKEKIQEIFGYLKQRIVAVAKHISKVAGQFARNLFKLRRKIANLESLLHQVKKTEPGFAAIKAESWCEYLCYSQTGFDKGLKNVVSDTQTLVSQHTEMASAAVSKYTQWFTQHASQAGSDTVFASLNYTKDDFLMKDMSVFNRSVGLSAPRKNNVFYRTAELPGGRAYYVQADPTNNYGMSALSAFEAVGFDLALYNPASYNVMKLKIATVVALPVATWLHFVNPILGMAAAAATGAYLGSQKFAGTGTQIHIDKNMMFEVLSLDEIKKAIQNVRVGMGGLEQWNTLVLQKPWKSQDVDAAVEEIMKNELSTSNMRAYCNALLTLMTRLGSGIHTYSFRVYNAVLNFVEKSLKQYL